MTAKILTQWNVKEFVNPPMTDEQKHSAFDQYVRVIANSRFPWLMPLLEAADALILAQPGSFVFVLPGSQDTWHEIPEMSASITMVPWPEDSDIPQ